MKTIEENTIRLSVRGLVEFVCKSGDIDNRITGAVSPDAMLQGANAHRVIQKAQGDEYAAEVPLSMTFPIGEAELVLEGRADGIITEGERVTIDEIKGVYRDIALLTEPERVHLAQAEMYAYIYAVQHALSEVHIRITYVQLSEEEPKRKVRHDTELRYYHFDYTFSEIEEKALSYVESYRKWILFIVGHRKERKESLSNFPFPYAYRPGQKKIVHQVYRTCENGKMLFVQAPTGIGKTMAMLYPSIQAIGQDLGDKIFYLTAKTVTAKVAEDTMGLFSERGLRFSFVRITAKEKLCPLEKCICNPDNCERAKGHLDRVNDAVYDCITHESLIDAEKVKAYAEKHCVCPFEMNLDLSYYTDVIICDYNYAFAPHVKLQRFFSEGLPKDSYFLLIDEAHNLVDRGRDMYSSVLVKEDLLAAKKLFSGHKTTTKWIEKANKVMLSLKRECDRVTVFTEDNFPNALIAALEHLRGILAKLIDRAPVSADSEKILDFYFNICDFLDTSVYSEGYMNYAAFDEEGNFYMKLFCINPASRLMECFSEVGASVLFSATFLPINYYKELLCGNKEEDAMYVDSPFDPGKRRLLLARDVSSSYKRRSAGEYEKIAAYIRTMVHGKPGNYLAFFPSHKFLEEVRDILSQDEDMELISQTRAMREEERAAFLSAFSERRGEEKRKYLLGLSVMGGVFSEGIDLTGEQLIGVAVVGTGLPLVCTERELIRTYYEAHGEDGFDFAYRFPGFNKVMQAAGRLIRTTEDMGVILLLDERFRYRENQRLFPREWMDHAVSDLPGVETSIREFWEGNELQTDD